MKKFQLRLLHGSELHIPKPPTCGAIKTLLIDNGYYYDYENGYYIRTLDGVIDLFIINHVSPTEIELLRYNSFKSKPIIYKGLDLVIGQYAGDTNLLSHGYEVVFYIKQGTATKYEKIFVPIIHESLDILSEFVYADEHLGIIKEKI